MTSTTTSTIKILICRRFWLQAMRWAMLNSRKASIRRSQGVLVYVSLPSDTYQLANKDTLKVVDLEYLTPTWPSESDKKLRLQDASFVTRFFTTSSLSATCTMEKRTPSPDGSEKVATSTEADGNLNLFNPDVDTSGVDERKLLRKIDFALIPWLSLLYLLSFLDRSSIGKWALVLPISRRCELTFFYSAKVDMKTTRPVSNVWCQLV